MVHRYLVPNNYQAFTKRRILKPQKLARVRPPQLTCCFSCKSTGLLFLSAFVPHCYRILPPDKHKSTPEVIEYGYNHNKYNTGHTRQATQTEKKLIE